MKLVEGLEKRLEEMKVVEEGNRNEDAVEAFKEEDDIIRGMTALQLETLRLEKNVCQSLSLSGCGWY